MARSDERTSEGKDLEARYVAQYQAALAEWRVWDARAVEAMSCDVAVAAQRSLEELRGLEGR